MTDRCAGVRLRGYRRGEQCGAIPKYASRGKMYCAAHYTTAQKEPKRFREAIEAYVRGEARREAQRRATKAQIDAFPVAEDSCGGRMMSTAITSAIGYNGSPTT